jgi:predicted GNAT superfamily acetyltransferase
MGRPEKILTAKGRRFLLTVETSKAAEDYGKYEALRNDIWGFPEDSLPGSRNMMCENFLYDGSSLFLAAYAADPSGSFVEDRAHLVGFSYGFVGVRDKTVCFRSLDNLWFYSQYTGVLPAFYGYGLGLSLKEFQKEVLVGVFGVTIVTCTFDPLTGVNAARNIRHFGMDVLEYRAATYGEYGGHLNRLDVPTDRFFIIWDLKKPRSRPDVRLDDLLGSRHEVVQVEPRLVPGRSGFIDLEIVRGLRLELDSEFLLVRIPRDFYLLLWETDVNDQALRGIPLEWRMRTREAFQILFGRGYRIIDFRTVPGPPPANYYVLSR